MTKRRALINGLVCDCSVPVKAGTILGAFLTCRTDGDPRTVAAITALRAAGHVVYDSRIDLASEAPPRLKKHNHTFGPNLWTPRLDDDGNEVPKDFDSMTFLVVVRNCQVWYAGHHTKRQSILWVRGDLASWNTALGELVLKTGPIRDDMWQPEEDDEEQMPREHCVLEL